MNDIARSSSIEEDDANHHLKPKSVDNTYVLNTQTTSTDCTPLASSASLRASTKTQEEIERDEFFDKFGHDPSMWEIICKFSKLVLPSCIYNLSLQIPIFTNIVVGGHMTEDELAAIGIGSTICGICILSILFGINSGVGTLASQAFGDYQYEKCGVYLNRGRFVQCAFSIPLCLVLFFWS